MDDAMMEALAADEHERWSRQAKTALYKMTDERRERWTRLADTPYSDLSEDMKELDRVQVRERLAIMAPFLETERAKVAKLREFAEKVDNWSKAYPTSVFHEPTPEQAREAFEKAGFTMDCFSAMVLREFTAPWGKLARTALVETEGADYADRD